MQVWVRAEKSTGKCECTKKHLNYKQIWVCTENQLESLSMLRNIHKQASAEQTSLKSIFHFYTVQKDPKEAILIYVNVNLTQYGTVKNDVLFIIEKIVWGDLWQYMSMILQNIQYSIYSTVLAKCWIVSPSVECFFLKSDQSPSNFYIQSLFYKCFSSLYRTLHFTYVVK